MDSGEVTIKTILNEKILIRYYDEIRSGFISYFRKKYNLDPDTVSDIYQETFYIVYKKMKYDALTELSCSLKTFIYSIGSNQLLTELKRKQLLTQDLENSLVSEISIENDLIEEEEENGRRNSIINEEVNKMTELCRSILKMFYWQKMKLPDILFNLSGYQSLDALKTQKYKCMKKLEENVKVRLTVEGLK
jgi:RNA polymerase sigma factor (sigma-70 family)